MFTEKIVLAIILAARPSFRSRNEKVAFAVHATFVASGYVLHATGRSAFHLKDALACSTAVEVGVDNWNEFQGIYSFVYSNPKRGSRRVVMNCRVVNDNLLVDVLKEGDSEHLHHEIYVPKYVDQTDSGSQFKNLGKLVADVNKEIICKLEGSSWATSWSQGSSRATSQNWSQPSRQESSLIDDPPYDLRQRFTRPPPPRYIVPSIRDSQPDLFHLLDPTRDEPYGYKSMYMRGGMGGYMPDDKSSMCMEGIMRGYERLHAR